MATDKHINTTIKAPRKRGFLPEAPPREVWVGILGFPLIGVAIGAFNYFHAKKDFKTSLKKKVQVAYDRQIKQYCHTHEIPRENLTHEDYAKLIDKEKCISESQILETKRSFIKGGKHGWTIAGVITGFAVTSIVGGIFVTTAPFSIPTTLFVGLMAGVAAVVGGVSANFMAGKAVAHDADQLILQAVNSPKNQQGIDLVEAKQQEKSHDKQKERITQKIIQREKKSGAADLADRLANPEKYIPADGFVAREKNKKEARQTAIAK